ncbi:hypothetical protein ONZ45_g17037 [Pleurotus djamor]|nr:hypothetical protein ONZ45_g17037 [Pleurotus djamor]
MYCLNGNERGTVNQNSNAAVQPLFQLRRDDWWFHHVNNCDQFPPAPGDFLELPAGGQFTVEHAVNQAATTLSFDGRFAGEWTNGQEMPSLSRLPDGNLPCIGEPNIHTQNESMAAGTAFAISYESDITRVTPENLVVFTVAYHTPWRRIANYSVPSAMPACPEEGCICAWGWVPNGCGEPNMYMLPYRCRVTNVSPSGSSVRLASGQPAVWCEDDPSRCTRGAKQMIFWNQAEGNNIEVSGADLSGFWETMPSNYFPEDDDDADADQESRLLNNADYDFDDRTRLDKTIDRIGMGSYQWTLLSLCGLGWMADNMWIQAIAIILPRVQRHYGVPDSYIGTLSSSMFAGMMFGAVGWGACSDLMGRSTAFNATLFFTSVFGILASFSRSFGSLCVVLFLLGSSVGGSMPTDGTLLLEHMPNGKQYLVTALSVFFSIGAVLAAVVALILVPQHSCKPTGPCDPQVDNTGWQYLLTALGTITLTMFLARMVFFKLHESPRYLVHAGRPQEALESLQMISRFNGSDLSLVLDDVDDQRPTRTSSPPHEPSEADKQPTPPVSSDRNPVQTSVAHYQSTGESSNTLESHSISQSTEPLSPIASTSPEIRSPIPSRYHDASKELGLPPSLSPRRETRFPFNDVSQAEAGDVEAPPTPRTPRRPTNRLSSASLRSRRRSSLYENSTFCARLPSRIRRPLLGWVSRVSLVLTPEWLRTTLLVWGTWFFMSLAYTMFNVFLPKLLESSAVSESSTPEEKTLHASLWDVVIFTLGGCPGAILGAYMVESSLGKRWSLAGSTFITAIFCVIFVWVESPWAVRTTTVGISLSATAMWAVLYGWTPEIFSTKVRGSACGIASALSRIGGMIAPMLGGVLLMVDRSVPVYTSVVVFVLAGCCVLLLKEARPLDGAKGQHNILH